MVLAPGARRWCRRSPRPTAGPRSRRTSRAAAAGDRDRAAVDRPREDRRLSSGRTRSTRSTASGSRSGSPTTSCAGYGTGAIMAVPAHDERDFAFARRFGLPIRRVIALGRHADDERARRRVRRPHAGARSWSTRAGSAGWPPPRACRRDRRLAGRGRPGQGDGHVPPARLAVQPPALLGHADPGHLLRARRHRAGPRRGPAGPAARHGRLRRPRREPAEPRRGVPARRLPALRRARPARDRHDGHVRRFVVVLVPLPVARARTTRAIDRPLVDRWTPVDQYTGGAEHAVMHLMYSRFWTKAMRDLGLVAQDEPFMRLFNQGQILGADGERMSKSRGNVQDPDDLVARYGADTIRLFLMFMGPWDQGGPWSPTGHRRRPQVPGPDLDARARSDRSRARRPRRRDAAGRRGRDGRRPGRSGWPPIARCGSSRPSTPSSSSTRWSRT